MLKNQLKEVSAYLKYGYCRYVDKDEDPAHDSNRAVERWNGEITLSFTDARNRTKYLDYFKPFNVIENVRSYANQDEGGVKVLLDDASNNFMLFMQQKLRCHTHLALVEEESKNRKKYDYDNKQGQSTPSKFRSVGTCYVCRKCGVSFSSDTDAKTH